MKETATVKIFLAEGDPAGSWKLELRDRVSGQSSTIKIKVTAARAR